MTEAQLRAFVAVAESGSFGDAAMRLHMSQPGISRAVGALERELGGDLFRRGHGSVALTALGQRALARSRAILGEAEAMRHEHDELRGIASGQVRLGSMPSVSSTVLPALLSRVERRHPALSITVLDGHDDELITWLRTGLVDGAIVAGQHQGLQQQPLLTDEMFAVLPAAHPLATRSAITPRALAQEPFILTRAGCERVVLATLAADGAVPRVAHEVTEASSILAMVGERLGVSIMPGLAAASPPSTVVLRPLRPRTQRRLSLAIPGVGTPSPGLRAFLGEAETWSRSRERRTTAT